MIGNKLELNIIGLFNRDISLLLSINQIAKKLNKAYPHINAKVNELIEQGILNKVQVGRSYLCSINLNDDKAVILLSLNEAIKKDKLLQQPSNKKLLEEISLIKNNFKVYTIFILGKKLIFVLDHIYDKEAIKNKFNQIKKFQLEFFTKQEFQDKAFADNSMLKDHIILYSPVVYYELFQRVHSRLIQV